ncbi:MAG TPA: diguanylate cyclase [Planctomycetaceae bacterium]|nr:diguanylate cyclase [Rubinisphaera sp.]HCS55686.1 diguanylate cyclase [Planctomycetaceae bacterium]|tara:strand:- start:37914 stop:40406 length:2493 start_codon:yes stop_codon:yes gene_type:complete
MESNNNIDITPTSHRIAALLRQNQFVNNFAVDRLFVGLMVVQWVTAIAAAIFISPKTWIGTTSATYLHVWTVMLLGGAISSLPVFLRLKYPGQTFTRYVIAVAQVLWSLLLIYLTGGRIETYFHIFVSLAFLSFYREWRLLVFSAILLTVNQLILGVLWPHSVYGVFIESPLRWFEHTIWVIFEVMILGICCRRSQAEMRINAEYQEHLARTNRHIEQQVQERTRELNLNQQKLSTTQARLQAMLDSTLDPMITINCRGIVQTASNSVETVFGWKPDELIGQNIKVLMPEPYRSNHDGYLARYQQTGKSELLGQPRELHAMHRDGTVFHCLLSLWKVDIPDQSEPLFMGILRNITEEKRLMTQLHENAYHDVLTGLPNRLSILDSIQGAIDRNNGDHFALLFLDFDGFKLINDSLGHEVGDELLKAIATRLRCDLRKTDKVQAARLGGDEFVVLLTGLFSPSDAIIVTERLLKVLSESYKLGTHTIYSSASIGIASGEDRFEKASDMLRAADMAMYEAKAAGKACYVVFDHTLRSKANSRLQIENGLRQAIEMDELVLAYQPIISLETGRLSGVEALLRWVHPELGNVYSDKFISIAEETGMIVPIGRWVIDEACRQFADWQHSQSVATRPLCVHVNVSRKQLLSSDFVRTVEQSLARHAIPSGCLHLEVTESVIMEDPAATIAVLNQLKQLGVKIDIDDFGTGYSSLSCLQDFPIDVLKIDRTFVANIGRVNNFAALLQAILVLADNLNLQVVAEGIEDADQLALLQALGCEYGQGYFFAKPMPPNEIPVFASSRLKKTIRKFEALPRSLSMTIPAKNVNQPHKCEVEV